MKKIEVEQKDITIHWWNFGIKTLDFKGTYKECLLSKGIKFRQIKHPVIKGSNGYRFIISCGCTKTRLDIFSNDFIRMFNDVIIHFLTCLGDKALFCDGDGRKHYINWR
jgi:hypothetical protein